MARLAPSPQVCGVGCAQSSRQHPQSYAYGDRWRVLIFSAGQERNGQRLATRLANWRGAMPRLNLSISGVSVGMAVALAIWEVLFFFFGWFAVAYPDRLGFQLAWMTTIYLSF